MSTSQKRLTRILLVFAIFGSLAIDWMWWDSMVNIVAWRTNEIAVVSTGSLAGIAWLDPSNFYGPQIEEGFSREPLSLEEFQASEFFPVPFFDIQTIGIPYYLILVTYLGTLTLIWLTLMNRLARQEAIKESRSSNRQD